MTDQTPKPYLPLWPFIIFDVLFLGLAYFLMRYAHRPLQLGEAALVVVCVIAGAVVFLFPFVRRNSADQQSAQAATLAQAVAQIKNLETVATQIGHATAQWQGVQEHATKTNETAKELAADMAAEARTFTDFLKKAGDAEKARLRVEVEKLRRAEGEWLQILTRILDHVFALSQAALASGQPNVIEQIGHFQNSCRDVARRIGLVPFVAKSGEPLDPTLHQLLDETSPAGANALVAETIATGFTYQGQMIRRAVVSVHPELELANKLPEPAEETLQPGAQPTLI